MGVCREGEGEQLMAAGLEVARRASQGGSLPLGFRFHSNDEEILIYYLKNKIEGRKPDIEVIREIDLYKCEPWDLPGGKEEKELVMLKSLNGKPCKPKCEAKCYEKELVMLKSLNGKPCKPKYEAKCYEKPPQIVNVKSSPRRIQQPR